MIEINKTNRVTKAIIEKHGARFKIKRYLYSVNENDHIVYDDERGEIVYRTLNDNDEKVKHYISTHYKGITTIPYNIFVNFVEVLEIKNEQKELIKSKKLINIKDIISKTRSKLEIKILTLNLIDKYNLVDEQKKKLSADFKSAEKGLEIKIQNNLIIAEIKSGLWIFTHYYNGKKIKESIELEELFK